MFGEESEDKSMTKTLIEAMVSMRIVFIPFVSPAESYSLRLITL